MSNHTIKSVRISEPRPGDTRQLTAFLSDNRRVIYGPGTQPRIIVSDEDDEIELSRHRGDVLEVLVLSAPKQSFLTCGADHVMMIWNAQGRWLGSLTGHTDRILGVWEIKPHRVVSLAGDGSIRVWDTRDGREVARIATTIASVSELLVATGGTLLCVLEWSGARVLTPEGTQLVVLQKQTESITWFCRLASDNWITDSLTKMRLWSRDGRVLHEFAARFPRDKGFLELDGRRLLVVDDTFQLLLFDEAGRLTADHQSPDLARMLWEFFASHARVETWMAERPSYQDFEHRHSPFAKMSIASAELEKLDLPRAILEKNRRMWDFFNRPSFKAIKTALKEEIAAARTLESYLAKTLEWYTAQLERASRRRTLMSVLLAVAVAVGALVALSASDSVTVVLSTLLGGGAAVFSARDLLRQHRVVTSTTAGIAVLGQVQPEIDRFIKRIKDYRRGVLAQVPVVRSPDAYDGGHVVVAMEQVLKDKLEPLALQECGLDRDDVIFVNQEAITLRDWAFIQNKSDAVRDKISRHNESSFWWSHDQFIFAVQYIQFIFLTADKIDVFATYYDFITDKAIAKEAHAFYYKDVTNIAKRDVDRSDSKRNFEATEIIMAVSSGQRIHLTIMNEQGVAALCELANSENADRDDETIVQLQQDRERVLADATLKDDERIEELKILDAHVAQLRTRRAPAEPVRLPRKVDQAIENIRAQIRNHKQFGGTLPT